MLGRPLKTATPPPTAAAAQAANPFDFDNGGAAPQAAPMAAALGPGGGVWRPVSPAFLALSLAFFFLPFVDVRCSSDGKSIVTETGLEAAYGGYTPSPETAAAARARRPKARPPRTRSRRRC